MIEPRSIIRNKQGKPDDIVIEGVTCFRMERMDTGHVWIAAYRGDERVTFGLHSDRKIRIDLVEDDFGCVDDTNEC